MANIDRMSQTTQSLILYEPDETLRVSFVEALGAAGWQCEIVSGLGEASSASPVGAPALVLLSAEGDGGEEERSALEGVCRRHAGASVVVMSGEVDEKRLLGWMRCGVRDVLRRPVDAERLVAYAAQHVGSAGSEMSMVASPELAVQTEVSDRHILSRAIQALIEILEARDAYCVGYAKAVTALSVRIAGALDLPTKSVQAVQIGGLLHDVGRVGLRDEVVHKMGSLSPSEESHVATHVLLGERVLGHLFGDPEFLALVRHHHEWYNGRGYPDGLVGEEIPICARVLSVADAYVAMTQDRPHRRSKTPQDALREICRRAGMQFCPKVVGVLLEVLGYRRPDSGGEEGEKAPSGSASGRRRAGSGGGEATGEVRPEEAQAVSKDELNRRMARVVELRALSAVVADVIAMTSREDLNVDDLAAKIKCDHALTTKLLRLANSALYGSRMKVESIDRAVLKLGMDRIRQLVLGIGVIDQWRQQQDHGHLIHGSFWQHSMSTGLLARQIGVMIDCPEEQNAFTAGLLHDTGQLVLQEALGRNYAAILAVARRDRRFLSDVEREFLGIDHGGVMRTVGRNWGLPESLIEVMALHHAPWSELQGLDADTLQLLLCVRVANTLSHALGCGDAGLGNLSLIPDTFLDLLRLDRSALEESLSGIPRQVLRLGHAYGLSGETEESQVSRTRRPPQRSGFYVRERDLPVDPLWSYLVSSGAAFEIASSLKGWRQNPGLTWCWVFVSTADFAKQVITELQEVEGEDDRVRQNLLLVLPSETPEALQGVLTQARIQFIVEPWNVGALGDTLDRMRSVRPESEGGAGPAAARGEALEEASP